MMFDITILEVDGSLRNPIVVVVVILWTGVLGLVTSVARWTLLSARRRTAVGVGLTVVLLVLYGATPAAQVILGRRLYQVEAALSGHTASSVGFWGCGRAF